MDNMPDKLTEEEQNLALSAKDAYNLQEMCNTNGWKVLKEMYFDAKLDECKQYLFDIKNTDPVMIRAMVMRLDFIETMLKDIEYTVKIGLQSKEELAERKKKEGK